MKQDLKAILSAWLFISGENGTVSRENIPRLRMGILGLPKRVTSREVEYGQLFACSLPSRLFDGLTEVENIHFYCVVQSLQPFKFIYAKCYIH
jgi:hypothetical protein